MTESFATAALNQEIRDWLVSAAARIEIPFKRQKFSKKLGKVVLGVEVYLMRYGRAAVLEYTIYWPALAERCFERKSAPALTRRLMGPANRTGFRPDIYLASFGENRRALEHEVIHQGKQIFMQVNSPSTIFKLVSGNLPALPPMAEEEADWSSLRQKIMASSLLEASN